MHRRHLLSLALATMLTALPAASQQGKGPKTQVFIEHEGDYFRTRLTHSIEVAQVARTIAGVLDLNFALTEAVALAHDLGHPPFGHTGEEALNVLMAPEAWPDLMSKAIQAATDRARELAG